MKITDILLYIWQLPQNLLGLLLVAVLNPDDRYDFEGATLCYSSRMSGGISLGRYIVVDSRMADYTGKVERHELGHTMQSKILGPLYLLVIGLPSILWAAWHRKHKERSYFAFYTERWADKLGGVERC
jgi:hypothetical protein